MLRKRVGLDGEGLEAGLSQLQSGGTNLAVEVLWPPRDAAWDDHADTLLTIVVREDARLDGVGLARTPSEARALVEAGKIAMVMSLEGAHGIDARGVPGLAALHAKGLSLLGLTWSFSNKYAGSSGDGGAGLTALGYQLLVEANRLGVVLDVSHASDQTTMDVCGWSHAPVIASHSNADGVRNHARNLSDEAIRCVARTGGVIGVNLHGDFVGGTRDVAAAADQAEYLRRVGGPGVVALGSDFDGLIKPISGISNAGELGALWTELARRGWTPEDIRAMQGENFMRAWEGAVAIGRALRGE